MTEKSKLFKNLTDYALMRLRENVFNYMPLTFFVEIDASRIKNMAKVMLPFFSSFYALEDNKKKVFKYYEKLEDFNNGGGVSSSMALAKSVGSLGPIDGNEQPVQSNQGKLGNAENPNDEAFIFKHFYNNKKGLI